MPDRHRAPLLATDSPKGCRTPSDSPAASSPGSSSPPGPYKGRSWKFPIGHRRVILTKDPGTSVLMEPQFTTRLRARLLDPTGALIDEGDLGSGIVTNVGALYLAFDQNRENTALNCLRLAKYHAWGTSGTAAAVTDVALGTAVEPTNATAEEGTQSLVINEAGEVTYKSVKKIKNGSSTQKIEEWGLLTAPTLSATTGTPLTAVTETTATVTSTPLTASSSSVQGQVGLILKAGSYWGLVLSNTTSVVTLPTSANSNGWAATSSGKYEAAKKPGNEALTFKPVLFDHANFGIITVEKENSVEFVFELLVKSGG